LILIAGVTNALLAPGEGIVPLATAGLTDPNPVATISKVVPGAAGMLAVLAEEGSATPVPCA
jgi:hypothetical protein